MLNVNIIKETKNSNVDLSETPLKHNDIQSIVNVLNVNERVTHLVIRHADLHSADIAPLSALKHVNKLDLAHNCIDSSGAKLLVDSDSFDELNLQVNNIDEEGIRYLQEYCANNPNKQVKFGNNPGTRAISRNRNKP